MPTRERTLRKKYREMDDHDILIESAVTLKHVESHLVRLNGSIDEHAEKISQNCEDIASIQAVCKDRTRTMQNEPKRFRSLLIAMIVISSAAGALGANSENIVRILGI